MSSCADGARLHDVQERTKAGTGCGECKEDVERLIELYKNKHFCSMAEDS